ARSRARTAGRREAARMRRPASPQLSPTATTHDAAGPCRACGACCAYSRTWPRFALEDDAALAAIPPAFVDDGGAGMRCHGDRCSALTGEVGHATSCAVYPMRPDVCRACEPGDDA